MRKRLAPQELRNRWEQSAAHPKWLDVAQLKTSRLNVPRFANRQQQRIAAVNQLLNNTEPTARGLVISRNLVIPASELTWRFSASGGPGGQHANTSNTKAELYWSISESAAIVEGVRARLVEKLGDVLSVVASDERSQLRNRTLAERRFREKILEALVVDTVRKPTKRSKGSQLRRLDEKSARSTIKANRRRPQDD
jgi:ribosome-associated protein